MKQKLILVRGHNAYGYIEQVFDDYKAAHDMLTELKAKGYKEEWITLPWDNFDDMQTIIKNHLGGHFA